MVAENDDDTNRHRTRRLTEVATRLTQLRHRNADQLAAQRHATRRVDREAERRVKTALKAYAKAEVAVRAVERDRDDKAASLVQQIKQTREAAQVKIDELRHQQVMAMWQIGDAGPTAEQFADLLEIPLTETRRLLGAATRRCPRMPPQQLTSRTPTSRSSTSCGEVVRRARDADPAGRENTALLTSRHGQLRIHQEGPRAGGQRHKHAADHRGRIAH